MHLFVQVVYIGNVLSAYAECMRPEESKIISGVRFRKTSLKLNIWLAGNIAVVRHVSLLNSSVILKTATIQIKSRIYLGDI